MGDHVRGHIAGEGTLGGHGNGLCAVGDMELVGSTSTCTLRNDVNEGKSATSQRLVEVSVTQQPYQLLDEESGFKMVEIHFQLPATELNAFGRHMFPFEKKT